MKRITSIITSAKGFTLIEVVVVIGISMLLLIPISNILLTNGKIFNDTNQRLDFKSTVLLLEEEIKGEARVASKIQVKATVPASLTDNQKAMYIDGKKFIVITKSNRVEKEIYLGSNEIALTYEGKDSKYLSIAISDKEQEYRTTVKLENLQYANAEEEKKIIFEEGIETSSSPVLVIN